MSTYYVNANGTSTIPFDTPADGAEDFTVLLAGISLSDDDIIKVVDSDIIRQDETIAITNRVTVKSYSGNSSKPIIEFSSVSLTGFSFETGADDSTLENMVVRKLNPVSAVGNLVGVGTMVDGAVNNVTIKKCEFYTTDASNDSGMLAIQGYTCNNLKIINCIFYDIYCALGLWASSSYDYSDIIIINNTFYNINSYDVFTPTGGGVISRSGTPTGDVELYFYNNIVDGFVDADYEVISIDRVDTGGIDANVYNNVTTKYNTGVSGGLIGVNNKDADPLLIDPSNGDFNIPIASPCTDAGIDIGVHSDVPSEDFREIARPLDIVGVTDVTDGTDIGAIERFPAYSTLDVGSSVDVSSGDVAVESTVETVGIESYISDIGDVNFDDTAKWNSIIVVYKHAEFTSPGQKITLYHKLDAGDWKANGIFKEESNAGTWEKDRLIVFDKMNDKFVIERSNLNSEEDLLIVT